MSAAVFSRTVEVIDVFSSQRRHPDGRVHQLEVCLVEPWGLAVQCPTPELPDYATEITWLLPETGLRMTRFLPRNRHSPPSPTFFTAVYVQRDTRSWMTADLVLGLEVGDRCTPRITRSAEFAAAVAGRAIRQSEADYALRTVHRTLHEFSSHRDVNQWLAFRGISENW